MKQSEILKILSKYNPEHQEEYSLVRLGVFGSIAKKTGNITSDIDIVVDMEKPDLFILENFKLDLEILVSGCCKSKNYNPCHLRKTTIPIKR